MRAHLRIARPTGDLAQTCQMYCEGLGFETLGTFRDQQGFDGVMLGHADLPWHFEFTHHESSGLPTPHSEDLIVFYLAKRDEWSIACERAIAAGFSEVIPENPYWQSRSRAFSDRDGYRVVLFDGECPLAASG